MSQGGMRTMGNINVNIRMDETLKKQFEDFCSEIGMNMTTAFTVFAKKVVQENRIPFEISCRKYNTETIEAIEEVKMMKKNPALGKTYTNVSHMMEDILSDV